MSWDLIKKHFSDLILDCKDVSVKELLLQIKIDSSHDAMTKFLNKKDVKLLQDTLKYLEMDPIGLSKDGVLLNIIKSIYIYIPHKCSAFERIVSTKNEGNEFRCV